ncbi:hypothetical protein KI387_024275, partial [Taxus chinensis]
MQKIGDKLSQFTFAYFEPYKCGLMDFNDCRDTKLGEVEKMKKEKQYNPSRRLKNASPKENEIKGLTIYLISGEIELHIKYYTWISIRTIYNSYPIKEESLTWRHRDLKKHIRSAKPKGDCFFFLSLKEALRDILDYDSNKGVEIYVGGCGVVGRRWQGSYHHYKTSSIIMKIKLVEFPTRSVFLHFQAYLFIYQTSWYNQDISNYPFTPSFNVQKKVPQMTQFEVFIRSCYTVTVCATRLSDVSENLTKENLNFSQNPLSNHITMLPSKFWIKMPKAGNEMHARNAVAGAARRYKRLPFKYECPSTQNALQPEASSNSSKNGLLSSVISKTLDTFGRDEKPHFIRGFSSSSGADPQNDEYYDAYSSVTSSIHREEEGKVSTAEPIWNAEYRAKVDEVVFGIKRNTEKNNASEGTSKESSKMVRDSQGFDSTEEKLKKAKEFIMKEFAKKKEKIASKKVTGGTWIEQEETEAEFTKDKFVKGNDQFTKEKENIASKKFKGGPRTEQKEAKGKFVKEKNNSVKDNDGFAKEEKFAWRKAKGGRFEQEDGKEKFAKEKWKFSKEDDKVCRERDKIDLKQVKRVPWVEMKDAKGKFERDKDKVAEKKKEKSATEKENIGKIANGLEEEEEEEEDEIKGAMLHTDENIDDLFPQYSPAEKERMASELAKALTSFKLSCENTVPENPSQRSSRKLEGGPLVEYALVKSKQREHRKTAKEKDNFVKGKGKIENELQEENEDGLEGEMQQADKSTENWLPQLNPEEKEWRSSKLARALLEASLAQPDEECEEEEGGQIREEDQKSLAVGVIGPPNAGKSTLTNHMVGAKVAAVSRKTNTTTHEVLGVLTKGDTQILFFDTPGLMLNYAGHPYKDVRQRVESAWSSVELYDLLIVVIDAHRHLTRPDTRVIKLVNKVGEKVHPTQKRILCMNKVDLVEVKKDLLKVASDFGNLPGYDKFYMISGMKGSGVKDLVKYLMEQ